MQKVITINLNGNSFQLDEHGYEALRAYLEHAEAQLGGNPDASEILRDLEQSVAEKCQRLLGPGKTVVTTAEIAQILREIGPVESGVAPESPIPPSGAKPPQTRLSDSGRGDRERRRQWARRVLQHRPDDRSCCVCSGRGAGDGELRPAADACPSGCMCCSCFSCPTRKHRRSAPRRKALLPASRTKCRVQSRR